MTFPRPRRARFAALLVCVMTLSWLVAGCGAAEKSADTAASSSAATTTKITVFAAASLTEVFTEIGTEFMAANPTIEVVFNFAGSQDLAMQIEQGAPADVFASADVRNMERVAKFVGAQKVFAQNKLAIAVAPDNPQGISGLSDLARTDLKVVLAAPEVPAGKYAAEILAGASVTVKPVSLENTVKGVVTKISLGEGDAGIVYVTDVSAADGAIDEVDIPEAQNVTATYPIASVTSSEHADAAQAFVDWVLADKGQQVLQKFGFLPPATR